MSYPARANQPYKAVVDVRDTLEILYVARGIKAGAWY